MSNNPALFNAIISGITGGNQQRWSAQSGEIDYTIFEAVATTVATTVDALITPQTISPSQASLMQSICYGLFSNRDAANIRHDLPAIADGIVALFTQFNASLQVVPVALTTDSLSDSISGLQNIQFTENTFEINATGSLRILMDGNPMIEIITDIGTGERRLATFGATPIAAPTIVGATPQDQIDSLMTALVNLGLVIDGR